MGRTLLLRLAYEGTRFSGWQTQPGRRTVQGVLAEAITAVSGETVVPKGASRTDAGVHAVDQVVGFTTGKDHQPDVWRRALNANLPEDVVVLTAMEVPARFDPVGAAVSKRYRYRIHDAANRPVLARRFVWPWKSLLDASDMQVAARHLVGEHDFSSFENPSSPRLSKVRRITSIEISRRQGADGTADAEVWIEVEGNGFLFTDYSSWAFYDAMERAHGFFTRSSEKILYKSRVNAKKSVYYWDRPARKYIEEIYNIKEIIRII